MDPSTPALGRIHSPETVALSILWGRCVNGLGTTRGPFHLHYCTVLDPDTDRFGVRLVSRAPDTNGSPEPVEVSSDWTPDRWPGEEPARDYALAMALFYFEHEACERLTVLRNGMRPWHPHANHPEFTRLRGLWNFRVVGGDTSVLGVLTVLVGDRRKAEGYLTRHHSQALREYHTVLQTVGTPVPQDEVKSP